MQCIACSRPLELRWQEWREDGTCVEHGDAYVMIDGRPVCEACDWHQRQHRSAPARYGEDPHDLIDEDRAVYDDRPGTWDWKQAYVDQLHVYVPAGAHGSSNGRKRHKPSKPMAEKEAWEA